MPNVEDSFFDHDTNEIDGIGIIGDSNYGSTEANPQTIAELKQEATFTDWDFNNVWEINEGVSYPTLR